MISILSRSSRQSATSILRRSIPQVKNGIIRLLHVSSYLLQERRRPNLNGYNELRKVFSHVQFPETPTRLRSFTLLNTTIHIFGQPFDPDFLYRQGIVYEFLLEEFIIRCEQFRHYTPEERCHPDIVDILLRETKKKFRKQHRDLEELKDQEILSTISVYYGLLNQYFALDDFTFEDEKVEEMFTTYLEADFEMSGNDLADRMKMNPQIAKYWVDVFKTLQSVPLAVSGFKSYPLCPEERVIVTYIQYHQSQNPENPLSKLFNWRSNPNYDNIEHKDTKNTEFSDKFSNNKDFERQAPKDKVPNDEGPKNEESKKEEPEKEEPEKEEPENDYFKDKRNKESSKDKNSKEFKLDLEFSPKNIMKYTILFALLTLLIMPSGSGRSNEITFQTFVTDYLTKNKVKKVTVVNNSVVEIELNDNGVQQSLQHQNKLYFNIGSVESFERNLREAQDKYNIPSQLRVPVHYTSKGNLTRVLVNFLPTVLFLGAIYWMTKKATASMGGMGPMGFGKSTAKKFNQETDIKIKFKDVAGMEEAKQEVMEFVKFLQNPEKYEKLGAKIPRGAILSGPPGTGKTLLAKATAGEAGVPFYSVSGSEFVEMFVGVGASRVRDLFKTARENAPSIVFVDEIDAIGKQRAKGNASGANDERETTLNQLLVEMDGFDTTDHVVVLAGTNRPDILDRALMRPGRFDRHVHIDNPELQGRKEIFEVHLKKITLVKDIDTDLSGRLAALTPGFSGADIANVCNEAALIAARFNAEAVGLRHFELAIERVIGGVEKKSKLLNPEEQRIVAYHEAGHAICGWFLKYAHPLLKVSIIPRGQGALGYAQYLPPDQYLMSSLQLYDRMIMTLGGRVSEELHFASVTSGAHDDFKKVTSIAQSMVLRFGMSDKVGMVNYYDTRSQEDLTKPFSDETSRIIDEEVQRIVNDCYEQCKTLLKEKSNEVELVAQELLKKEFITREDMIRLLGKRPFPETNDAFDKYLDGKPAFGSEEQAHSEEKHGESEK